MQNLELKNPILGKFRGKIEILSTHNFFCRKFAASVEKLQLVAPPTFLTHDVAVSSGGRTTGGTAVCGSVSVFYKVFGLILRLIYYFIDRLLP